MDHCLYRMHIWCIKIAIIHVLKIVFIFIIDFYVRLLKSELLLIKFSPFLFLYSIPTFTSILSQQISGFAA